MRFCTDFKNEVMQKIKNYPWIAEKLWESRMMLSPGHGYSRDFRLMYDWLKKSQAWSKEEVAAYQWNKISGLLDYCYSRVPYYQQVFHDMRAHPEDFTSLHDFEQFPFLTKDIVRERLEDLLPVTADKKKLIYFTTGGSTGEPLGFYKEKKNYDIQKAFVYFLWRRVGFVPGARRVLLRGELLPDDQLFSYLPQSRAWLFSSYRLSRSTIRQYVAKLNEIRPPFLHVYPSSLFLFVSLAQEENLHLNFKPNAVLCASEQLYSFQRDAFHSFFGCPVYSFLAMAEGVILAGECDRGEVLELIDTYSYGELVDEEGKCIREQGVTGELTGTGFYNLVTPFIRYKTGDLASYSDVACSYCREPGRHLGSLHGRRHDFIRTRSDTKIPIRPSMFGSHDEVWGAVRRLQFVQDRLGSLIVRVECGEKFHGDVNVLHASIAKILGPRFFDLDVRIVFDQIIERTGNGKHKFFVQLVSE